MAQRDSSFQFDDEIRDAARERVIEEHDLNPDAAGDKDAVEGIYNAEWMDSFANCDPDNPNHILHNGEVLCETVEKDALTVPTKMFEHTRESLLHPETRMRTPDRFCKHCLEEFRDQYDFALDAEDLRCPDCGSQSQAVIDPRHGVTKCKGCQWGV